MWYGKFESARVFEIRPSRRLLISLSLLYLFSMTLAALMLPLLLALAVIAVLFWRGVVDGRHQLGSRRIVRLVAGAPGQWFARQADGHWREVRVAGGSVVYSRLLLLVLMDEEGGRCYLVLPRDALAADAHRRLRVLLWCQGAPSGYGDTQRSTNNLL
jgi:hypothetical protein